MRKTKNQKGITLVALIITIVVLLILAVVAIGAVRDSGIITHAQNAARDYNSKQKEEEGLLAQYETLIDEKMGIGPWKVQEDGTIKNGKTEEEFSIGQELQNDEVLAATGGTKSNYTGTWTILGVENGRLKLVSTKDVASYVTLGKDDYNVYKKAEDGTFVYDESGNKVVIDEIVEIFDKTGVETNLDIEKAIWSYQHVAETLDSYAKTATGIANARSITIEDLEAVDVLNITIDKKVELSANYGKTYNYFYNTEKLKVSSKNKALGSETWSDVSTSKYEKEVFVDKEGKTVVIDSENDKAILDHTNYGGYNFTSEQKAKFVKSLAGGNYWLASSNMYCENDCAKFGMRYVTRGEMSSILLFNSYGDAYATSNGVRAVVYI